MGDVVEFNGFTSLPIAPDDILEKSKGRYGRVIVIGVDGEDIVHIASSEPDLIVCNFDIDRAKSWIMNEVANP